MDGRRVEPALDSRREKCAFRLFSLPGIRAGRFALLGLSALPRSSVRRRRSAGLEAAPERSLSH
jgi:hypothetical protein